MKKLDFIATLKQLFKPEVGSPRWFDSLHKMTTQELKSVREDLFKELFDPNEDLAWRWKIRDKIFPYIKDILDSRDE